MESLISIYFLFLSFYFSNIFFHNLIFFLKKSPAGGLKSTLKDLSNFMISHMNEGEFNGNRILTKETSQEIRKLQVSSFFFFFLLAIISIFFFF